MKNNPVELNFFTPNKIAKAISQHQICVCIWRKYLLAFLDIKITRIDNRFRGVFWLILRAFNLLITSFAYLTYCFTDNLLFALQMENTLISCNHKRHIWKEWISSIPCSQMYKKNELKKCFCPEKDFQMIARKKILLVLPFLGLFISRLEQV